MRKALLSTIVLLLGAALPSRLPASQTAPVTPDAFFGQMQACLQKQDFPGYLELFSPDVRAVEQERLAVFFNDFHMESLRLRLAGKRPGDGGTARLYCQAYFEGPTSAMIEAWQLVLAPAEGGWRVVEKSVTGNLTSLYRIRIPSDRFERVRSVEITHHDIRMTFKDAAVFYDNIPDMETALVVVGRGTVEFAPSDANEKHQLEILYKSRVLQDSIDYAYVRCSNATFAANIRFDRAEDLPSVTPAEQAKAASVFNRNYSRSFTIENSIDGELLSFLPQGEETVIEFKGRKAGELTYIYYPFSDEAVNLFDRSKDRVVSLYSPASDDADRGKQMFISFEEKFDIAEYQLDMSYSPEQAFLSAKARIRVLPKTGRLDSLKLRLAPSLEILKIYDEERRELFYTQDKLRKILYIYFISPLESDAGGWIEVYYRGHMSPQAPTTDVIQTGVNDKYVFRPRYETFLFSHAGDWYPAPPDEDYFTARLKLVIPPEYRCIACGEMVERGRWEAMGDVVEIEKAGSGVFTFETRAPVKYLAFILGKYARGREWKDPVPIQTYVASEVMNDNPGLFDQAQGILSFYINSFGPFPFGKLDVVLRLWPQGGGFSPPSFVVLNQIPWADERITPVSVDSPVNLSKWDEYFLAHEIAHQWWGQGVSFSTYRDQWLSEGLAQFAAASFLRSKYGERAYAEIVKKFARWTEKKSDRGPIIMGSRLSFLDYEAYQSIVYNKSALALFMLQDIIGPDAFSAGLKAYFEKNKFRAARTEGFVAAMEKASGRDLEDFFRGWFTTYELPDVRVTWSAEAPPEGGQLKVRVAQLRSRFVFPLWVEWMEGGTVRREMVVVTEANQEFTIRVSGKPERVRINPDHLVPGKFS